MRSCKSSFSIEITIYIKFKERKLFDCNREVCASQLTRLQIVKQLHFSLSLLLFFSLGLVILRIESTVFFSIIIIFGGLVIFLSLVLLYFYLFTVTAIVITCRNAIISDKGAFSILFKRQESASFIR